MQTEFQKGQYVVYAANGVCCIEDVCRMPELSRDDWYYILRPVAESNSVYYIPTSSASLAGKIRALISAEEIDALIESLRTEEIVWIDDRKARMEYYRDVLRRSDPKELIALECAVYAQKQKQIAIGKKISSSDENALRQASAITDIEFSRALGVEPKEVGPYVFSRLISE